MPHCSRAKTCLLHAGHLSAVRLLAEAGEGPAGPARGQQVSSQQEAGGVQ